MLGKAFNIVATKNIRLNYVKNKKAIDYLELKTVKIFLANIGTGKRWTLSHSNHFCIAVRSRVRGHFLVTEFLQSFHPAIVEHLIFSNHVI